MSSVVTVTDANFKDVVSKADVAVVYYWADWCQPCKKQGPIMTALAEELGDAITIGKINSDENLKTATDNNVQGLPTIHIYNKGELVNSFQGARSKLALKRAIDNPM